MKAPITLFSLCILYSCNDNTVLSQKENASLGKDSTNTASNNNSLEKVVKTLESKIETLTVSYSAISCPCAQLRIVDTNHKDHADQERIYLSRANIGLPDADYLWDGVTLPFQLELNGRFYKEVGYPPG